MTGIGRPYRHVKISDPNQETVRDAHDNHRHNHDDVDGDDDDEWVPLTETGSTANTRNENNFHCHHRINAGKLWTSLVFGWFDPVLRTMQQRLDMGVSPDLEDDQEIPPLCEDDRTAHVDTHFDRLWEQEQAENPDNPSLVKCLWQAFSPLFIQAGFLKLTHDCLQFVGPQVLNGLIVFLREPTDSMRTGLTLTVAVTVAQLGMSLCLRHYFFKCYRVGLKVRTAVLIAIYKKSLRIDSTYYQKHPIGQITNLMSTDVQRLQEVISFLHAIWYSFLQIILAMYFLWQQLGPSCLAGVFMILLSIPFTAVTAQWMGKLQKRLMEAKDQRVDANQETVANMKVVKLQAWEERFRDKITQLRNFELWRLFIYDLGQACTQLLWSAVPLMIAVFTFGAYVGIAGKPLDVASALTALALFEILRFPLFMLPYVINMIVEAGVSMKRIQDFLSAPNYQPPPTLPPSTGSTISPVIQLKEATMTYQKMPKHSAVSSNPTLQDQLDDTEQQLLLVKAKLADAEDHLAHLEGRPSRKYGATRSSSRSSSSMEDPDNEGGDTSEKVLSLRRVNFECYEGEFVAVIGGVGAGKSTLLKAILGEVQKVSGEVGARGKIAYFDQKAFIMNDTVKGNILFGLDKEGEEDKELYKLAVKSACLEHDLQLLSAGDQTEIGEKGITLSGGQKARVALARAVYRDADVSLLDDCLSAVDAHVGRDLFDKCIIDVLLKKKSKGSFGKRTVVLVTNALQYLSNSAVDRIVVMKNGMVVETGKYKDMVSRNDSHFKSYLRMFSESMKNLDEEAGRNADDTNVRAVDATKDRLDAPSNGEKLSNRESSFRGASDPATVAEKKPRSLMTDEMAEREIGRVGREVYLTWARAAGGLWVAIPVFMAFTISQCIKILSNWWLTYWSHTATPDSASQLYFLGIYGLINIGAVIADFSRMVVVTLLGLRASRSLFEAFLGSTLGAPMSFYDTTPSGRIMNRFSKDIYTVDEAVPSSFQMYVDCFFQVFSTLVVITMVTPWFAVVLLPMLLFYRKQQAYFTQCYRELKRIDSVTRSPIYALFGETLDGFCTIRAFEAEASLLHRIVGLIDKQQHAYYLTQAGLCWLAVRLELVGSAIVFFACLAAVLEKQAIPEGNDAFAGLAGLSISYALSVTQSLNWAVRTGSDYEANMVSVERIREYTQSNQEASQHTEADRLLDADWPKHGKVEFQNAKMRYRPGLPLVLKGLTLTIPGRAKVGIVGRTGAGKSTLMTALMRLVELDSGSILLDGVDTRSVGLKKLRSNIAVIPQDPVLFSGTIKTNLDLFDEHPKDHLMDVLERVGLWSSEGGSASAVKSLSDVVQQDGGNFSAGQRQLLVIGRALLDGAALVICDEATSSIDAEADSRIQRVLRTDFANATTLTVAHRLNTIMDSSHILVMSDGKAVEFDSPSALLSKGGLFKDLVDKWEEEHE